MDEKILELLQSKPIVIPRTIFKTYKKLNITEEELILLLFMIDMGNKLVYNPEYFTEELGINKYKVMELINDLYEKKIIDIVVEKNNLNKTEEYITLDLLYHKLINDILDKKEEIEVDNSDIFSIFENELGRTISPMEYDMIKGWITDFNKEVVIEALKEAVYNGVNNFRYIDKILFEWSKKGIDNLDKLEKSRKKHIEKKSINVELPDYDWLNSDE